jgi:hypothetical protein
MAVPGPPPLRGIPSSADTPKIPIRYPKISMVFDVRRVRVRLHQRDECGELIWDKASELVHWCECHPPLFQILPHEHRRAAFAVPRSLPKVARTLHYLANETGTHFKEEV